MHNLFYKVFLALLVLFAASCAQVVTPTGGAKDITPPKVLKSTPGNFETNYNGNSLLLHFDEFVVVKDASSEIIVSPMIGGNPKINIKGKSVEIKFDMLPKPNTTYTVNLGKSIIDYNEGNILDSNLFVFSTGSLIDTLIIKGKITDAEWGKAEKDMFIMLYADTSDSVPFKKLPDYITKSNENGEFKIMHIKNGIYRVFALSDMNANYLFDLPDEKIAFAEQLVKFDSSLVLVNLSAFKETAEKQFISSAEFAQYGNIQMIFNLPVKNINVTPLNYQFKKAWFLMEQNQKKDTLNFWLTDLTGIDSLIIEISENGIILDTLELEIPKKPTESGTGKGGRGSGKMTSFELKAKVNGSTSSPLNYNDSLIITWSHPILALDKNKIILTQGKDTVPFKIETIDDALRKQMLFFNRKEDSTYNLLILPNAVEDIFGLKNDTVILSFKAQSKAYYGTINLSIEGMEAVSKNFIIDLLDEKNQVLKSNYSSNVNDIKFDYLAPGNYSFRLIFDENNNKKWDTGNYLNKLQPEKTYIYNGTVSVKSNWDNEIKWQLP